MPFLFAITLFVSATLLFLVQPMVAKMVLPRLGGTPAVWNTCMVFFQAALLAGYAYAHATTTWLSARRQVLAHPLRHPFPGRRISVRLPEGAAQFIELARRPIEVRHLQYVVTIAFNAPLQLAQQEMDRRR